MTLPEERLERLARRLERENTLFLRILARGYTVEEAEKALRACEIWILWGLKPPQAALRGVWRGATLRYNLPQPAPAGHSPG